MTLLALAFCLAAAQTDAPQRGMLQPAAATYTVTAAGGTVTISVTRVAGNAGAVGCSYTTVNGTAIAGTDYVAKTGTLSWANNDSAAKTVVITILDDGVVNGNKTFTLQLNTPTGGAYLGVPPTGKNQEGRVLGSTPTITVPVDWNTTTADGILQTLQILPVNNPWNEDITGLAVSPDSGGIIANMLGSTKFIHVNRDMNLTIIPGTQPTKTVPLSLYGSESDPGPYRVPDNMPIEGYLGDDTFDTNPIIRTLADIQQNINPTVTPPGDRHGTIIDPVNGYIYEFGNTIRDGSFNWSASGEATFALNSNVTRQDSWTSADAAGLPILPSIARYDECQRGKVEHALRFTAFSRADHVWPATHDTGSYAGNDRPRMGERFRLKKNASVDAKIAAMNTHPKAIALALQQYGMIMADNGSNWYLSTNSDTRVTNLIDLQTLRGDDFDVVVTTGPHEGPRATSTTAITITDGGGGGGGDVVAPTVAFTTPTAGTTYSTSSASVLFGGTAGDNVGVTSVTWTNSTGGSGTASGTTAWSALIALASGSNTITVTAHDAGGNNTSDVLTVTYMPPPPATGGGGGGGGGCGLTGLELLPLALLRRRRR